MPIRPPLGVARAAQRGLDVRAGKPQSQRGGTAVGLARARDLANRRTLSLDTILRMLRYFARHYVDREGATWDEQGPGWQAWQLWGGDPGVRWALSVARREAPEWYARFVRSPTGGRLLREFTERGG
jgi:hypothetical protein